MPSTCIFTEAMLVHHDLVLKYHVLMLKKPLGNILHVALWGVGAVWN